MKDTIKIENVRFYNQRKLAQAQAIAGDDFQAVLAAYEKLAGKFDIIEPPKKVAKKTTKRAKKVSKA